MTGLRRPARGLTLLEVIVSIAIMAMISILIYGAFDGLSKSKKGLGRVNERYHAGRAALRRMASEISSAYLSQHVNASTNLRTSMTAFVGKDTTPADRLDMTTFSHRRVVANARESDQNELSYFGSPDPRAPNKLDLARRESGLLDIDPQRGGSVQVLVEDIELFNVKFLDPQSSIWTDSWDSTTQTYGQMGRMPLQVHITLWLRGGPSNRLVKLEEKVPLQMLAPLSFAVPR
jgi:general secretion pathway protein J